LPYKALLDANVLHPMVLCDLLMRLSHRGLYRALWSRHILEETKRSILRRRADLSDDILQRRMDAMNEALPDAQVVGYDNLLLSLPALGEDAHVLAAAIVGGADVIVTQNTRDFPEPTLAPYRIAVQTPDEFLVDQWWLSPGDVRSAIDSQAAGTSRPPLSVRDVLRNLDRIVPQFVALLSNAPDRTRGQQ